MNTEIHNFAAIDLTQVKALTNGHGGGYGNVTINADGGIIHAGMSYFYEDAGMKHFLETYKYDPEKLKERIESDTNAQNEAFDNLVKAVASLTQCAVDVKAEERALAFLQYQLPIGETNQWVDENVHQNRNDYILWKSIKNAAFSFEIRIWEDTKRVRCSYQEIPVWKCDWWLAVNKNNFPDFMKGGADIVEATNPAPAFDTKDKAMAYATRKMQKVEKLYFSEMNPVIPEKYKQHFCHLGIPLPGYRFKEET